LEQLNRKVPKTGGQEMMNIIQQLAKVLIEQRFRMTTAESCTGGLIAAHLTRLAGSSAWFDSAIITYSNQAKIRLLEVSGETLACHGAVSQQTAQEMVLGVVLLNEVEVGISVTGIAGPDGGSKEKPVGTVWIAWNIAPWNLLKTELFHFEGKRDEIRNQVVITALEGLLTLLKDTNSRKFKENLI